MKNFPQYWQFLEFFDTCTQPTNKDNHVVGQIDYKDGTLFECEFIAQEDCVYIRLTYEDHKLVDLKLENIIQISFKNNTHMVLYKAFEPELVFFEFQVKPYLSASIDL